MASPHERYTKCRHILACALNENDAQLLYDAAKAVTIVLAPDVDVVEDDDAEEPREIPSGMTQYED